MAWNPGDIAYGASLSYSATEGGSYTPVAELTEITPPPLTKTRVDKTNHDSPDRTKEKRPGMRDPGEIDCKALLDADQLETLYTLEADDRTERWWKVALPVADGQTLPNRWVGKGFLADIAPMTPLDDKTEVSFKIVMSGKCTFHKGS